MKVLHVAHAWPPDTVDPITRGERVGSLGGTERYADALARAQARAGARVARFGPADASGVHSAGRPRQGRGVRAKVAGAFGRLRGRGFAGSYANAAVEGAFAAFLARERPEIVHVHHLAHLSAGLAGLARGAGARVVFTLHDAWVRCARGQLLDVDLQPCAGPSPEGCARCLAGELWAPAPLPLARRLPPRTEAVRARESALGAFLTCVDLVLSPSRHLGPLLGIDAVWEPLPLLDEVRAHGGCVSVSGPDDAFPRATSLDGQGGSVARGPRGPLAPGSPRVSNPSEPAPVRRILFLGSMIPSKGPDLALEAFRSVGDPRLQLTLAGPSVPWRGSLAWSEALAARARATPGVAWVGAVAPEDVPALLDAHDALVFASTWVENSPLVLREARAHGLLVLASDVPGAREVAPEATFFPPGDARALAEALRAAAAAPARRRAPIRDAPTLAEHASALLTRYESLLHP